MNCPYCGAELPDEALRCTACGQSLTAEPAPATSPETEPETEPVYEPATEIDSEPASASESKSARGPRPALIATVAVVVVALVVMALVLVRQAIPTVDPAVDTTTASDPAAAPDATDTTGTTSDGADAEAGTIETVEVTPRYPVTVYSTPAQMPVGTMETQVGTYAGQPITNRDINYYYWGEYYYLLNTYGSYLTMWMDPSAPLGTQAYDASTPDYTWQDYLLEAAETTLAETRALVALAEAEGLLLSAADTAYMEQTQASLVDYAESNGYESVDAYLEGMYGPGANEENFMAFLEDSLLSSSYAQQLYGSYQYTDEEISDYYTSGGYADQGLTQEEVYAVDVRHVLITPATDDEGNQDWEAALAQAEALLTQWQADPTEAAFAQLANTYSEDPGSNTNGGLYSGVQPGQMVETFDQWCFDENRQPGDTGIVETTYGYHIMYFSARAERPLWMETVETDMRQEAYINALRSLVAEAGFAVDHEAVALVTPSLLYG